MASTVTIGGIIKGSGMIAPDMATMLGYVFTDARWSRRFCRSAFRRQPANLQLHHRR
jgi:glutamate N-acetyltransferase/amino-acid N-acetyltransferase